MGALLRKAPFFEHENLIGMGNGAEPVGNQNRGVIG